MVKNFWPIASACRMELEMDCTYLHRFNSWPIPRRLMPRFLHENHEAGLSELDLSGATQLLEKDGSRGAQLGVPEQHGSVRPHGDDSTIAHDLECKQERSEGHGPTSLEGTPPSSSASELPLDRLKSIRLPLLQGVRWWCWSVERSELCSGNFSLYLILQQWKAHTHVRGPK